MAASNLLEPPSHNHPPCIHSSTTSIPSLEYSFDSDGYKMMVLRFSHDTTEEEVDRHFLRTALDLGINVPQDPKTTLELVTKNVSALEFNPAPPEHRQSPSRTSDSTHPTSSSSSSEQPRHTKSSSLTSMTSPPSSVTSAASHKSSYTKIRTGIRRMSTLRRRKTIDAQIPPMPIAAITALRPPPPHRPATVDQFPSCSIPRKPVPPPSPEISPLPPVRVPIDTPQHQPYDPAARERSLHQPQLKNLRWAQVDEQRRFVRFEADQYRLMRSRQLDTERRLLEEHPQKLRTLQQRHADALATLEHRHLSAEVDLERTLEIERQACGTRLKHMQAYCNPRHKIEGMPNRVVTKQHHRQLEQQRYVWAGIDNLHAARINVLREKQAKQLERVMGKQEAELEAVDLELSQKMQRLDERCRQQEGALKEEFRERRRRLVKRWDLAEAIQRRRLENETGEVYGALPAIEWGDEQRECEGGEEEEDGGSVDGLLAEEMRGEGIVYDAARLDMI
ncbi:MAG: hypothetical protein LQ350_001396 [Teloschistes chrysophthalmus]|nr:MAG: hypothetical protein LQ350_001396 [Niorma chrysophthalma]